MNQKQLTEYLISTGVLRSKPIIEAFQTIDRADFVLPQYKSETYEDYPLPIGQGQTISQPTTVVFMLELLQPEKGGHVLDVGSGSGWTTALLADIVGREGEVWGVEIVPELVELGNNNLQKYNFPWARIVQAGETIGFPDKAPFDRILVSASGEELPEELIKQLKIGGRLVIPIRNSIWQIDKTSENIFKELEFPGFVFVPLK